MKNNKVNIINIIIIGLIFLSFAVGIYFYPQMPLKVASHWNIRGEVDDYMPKFWGLFLMPIISVIMFLFFILIPKIDPLKNNIEKFRKYYDWFILFLILFLFYIYVLTIIWNLGVIFNMSLAIVPAIGLFFYYIGLLLEKSKRNWFIGIRTPWTLSSESVWEKTHKIGGKLFKIAGALAFLGLFFSEWSLWFVIIPVISFVIFTFFYSYFVYARENKK